MDYQFPQQLFPSFYNSGPPDSVLKHCAGRWGSYDRVRPQGGSGPLSSWTFTSRHQIRGETWRQTEPVPVPLLSPKNSVLWPSTPPDPLEFTKHMQNFFMDYREDAFGCMSEILGEHSNFRHGDQKPTRKGLRKKLPQKDSVNMWRVKDFLDVLQFEICQQSYRSRTLDQYTKLMSDVVPTIPPRLLGSLLYEELTEQRDRMMFSEASTGGALAFVPFSLSCSSPQRGYLLYPGKQGMDRLNFHRVVLQHQRGSPSCVDASSSDPFSFQLKGPVRQISCASLLDDCCVAVRSDHLCGVWRFSETKEPHLLQVVNTREVATCINASPHVLGEVLVASESGAAKLWTVGRGMQNVREEDSNLYFNAKSLWRWCEFSAHPRVMVYADRTGVELTDMRMNPVNSHSLFRISNTSDCRSGERLFLSRYLGDVHCFHHLISTQHSAYIMDERFPTVPMLKWDHMMQSPPMFCHVVPGSVSSGSAVGGARSTKVLLGSQRSQEIMLLQYSGGRAEACFGQGPPQGLLRPRDSLKHLPVQIPHRLDTATDRLSSNAAGLTCIQNKGGGEAGGEECICVLQLTEAGDIFYQILESEQPDTSRHPAAEEEPPPQRADQKLKKEDTALRKPAEQLQTNSQLVVSDTSSDEGVIEPTQHPAAQRLVPETPEREQRPLSSDSSSEDSESGGKGRHLKQLLQVIVNDNRESELDADVTNTEVVENAEEPSTVEEEYGGSSSSRPVGLSTQQTPVKLSESTLLTWKHWLQKLMRKVYGKKPRPHCPQHFKVKNKGGLHLSVEEARDLTKEERVQTLRRNLKACMSNSSLLVNSAVSSSLEAQEILPMPKLVDTNAWADNLSHRLTLSWEGEEGWSAWWEGELGLNRDWKVAALRKKRRREKEKRRAAGRRLELSGSFTSSISYQSEYLDDLSGSGWTSAASQGAAWSDSEGMLSEPDGFWESRTSVAATPSSVQADSSVSTSAASQRIRERPGDLQTPNSSHSQTQKPVSTPTSQRKNRRPLEDYLRSMFATQDEPSQHDHYFLEEGSNTQPPTVASSSCQLRSNSQPVPVRNLRVDLSQDIFAGPSPSQSLSQSSQGRLRPSQASQPRKKSRMGF
ncbi:TATA box-binding protein-associated factor, RNA polymerase I, subunit C [Collichthys lucidus]|uniref:TATA box-binding protein-associated factor, RNA polymerase I, subunit C n=1 Tax=Collichthys lucidus TaxID=240159 RepID=A0A4U5V878_COLLU|nr:TATA box-binding protein-associated factor, RNA polymerase I, subunit C [Collichthys lucidus]